jgi:hypothetical protein
MAYAFVQTKMADSGITTSTTLAVTMDAQFGAGNAAVVFSHDGDPALGYPTCADNKSNTYTEVTAARITDSVNSNKVTAFYAENLGGSGAATVTLTWPSAIGYRTNITSEYSGIKTSGSLVGGSGQNQVAIGPGTDNLSSGNINFTSQPALLTGWSRNDSTGANIPGAGTGFTSRGSDAGGGFRWEDRRVTATGNAEGLFSVVGGIDNYNTSAIGLLEAGDAAITDGPKLVNVFSPLRW